MISNFENKYICFVMVGFVAMIFAAESEPGELQCGENEIFNPKSLPCYEHCVTRQIINCPYPTKPACECKDGFIRRTQGGPCIPFSDCRFLNP